MAKSKIFVYGTLMKDFRNYNIYLKNKATSIAKAYIYGKLYHLGNRNCPAIIDGTDKVYGQVIEFDDDEKHSILNKIDKFEKYFFDSDEIIYERTKVLVHYMNDTVEELSYYRFVDKEKLSQENAQYIPSGDWGSFRDS